MTETIDLIVAISMLLNGLIITLMGFGIIKLKAMKPEYEERMIDWREKFGKFLKIGGIVILVIGVFLLFAPHLDSEPVNWTESQKVKMKQQVISSSNFLQSINSDTADLVVTCFVDKYTEKFTLQDSWEQDKLTQEQIMELIMPIMRECFELYDIQNDK
jgi:hypothetical protein